MGASNFDQNSNNVTLRQAGCTSVPFQKVDLSAYWAVSLVQLWYFRCGTHSLLALGPLPGPEHPPVNFDA